MAKINSYYGDLNNNYLFSEIAARVAAFKDDNPEKDVISLGIGDVTRPLAPAVVQAMKDAAEEMGKVIKGYCPEQGYDFLRNAISLGDYQSRGLNIDADEIFVSDGAKCDTGNITEIFALENKVAICDPVYPVYLDTNVMCGRAGNFNGGRYENILYMDCVEENNFLPAIPKEKADLIYLCFPNNPTGGVATKEYLTQWVQYALANEAVILYDGAYEAFIQEPGIPKSIYEIEGARKCAIEFRSFSKTAGFTGVRCAYTVVPKELKIDGVSLNDTWKRRQTTKFNGVSYIVQKGAEAVYSAEGQKQIAETIGYYRENAKLILDTVKEAGFTAYGGVNAPYIWFKTPHGLASWDFFDKVLQTGVVITPGVGFGSCGEGFMRITAFGGRENTKEALRRLLQVKA